MSIESHKPQDEEELLHSIHHLGEQAHTSAQEADSAFEAVRHSEFAHSYELYEQGSCPTLDRIDESVRAIVDLIRSDLEHATDSAERTELERTIRYFEARRDHLAYATNAYTSSIASMWRLRHNRPFMNDEQFMDRLSALDARRRRQHDAIMDSLREYGATVQRLVDTGLLGEDEISVWNGWSQHAGSAIDEGAPRIVVFAPGVLTHERRAEIQQWAIAADLSENLRLIKAHTKDPQEQ